MISGEVLASDEGHRHIRLGGGEVAFAFRWTEARASANVLYFGSG